jgi:hypothetical protein
MHFEMEPQKRSHSKFRKGFNSLLTVMVLIRKKYFLALFTPLKDKKI